MNDITLLDTIVKWCRTKPKCVIGVVLTKLPIVKGAPDDNIKMQMWNKIHEDCLVGKTLWEIGSLEIWKKEKDYMASYSEGKSNWNGIQCTFMDHVFIKEMVMEACNKIPKHYSDIGIMNAKCWIFNFSNVPFFCF